MEIRYAKYYYNDAIDLLCEELYKEFPKGTSLETVQKDFEKWTNEKYNKRFVDKNFLLDYSNFNCEDSYYSAACAMEKWYNDNLEYYWKNLTEDQYISATK